MAGQWLDSALEKMKVSRRDVKVFLTSLLLAFGIWLLYNMNQYYSSTLQARVYVTSNLPGYFPQSAEPVTVEARCRASGYDVIRCRRRMRGKPVSVKVDPDQLTDVGDGQFVLSANALGGHVAELFGSEVRLESFISPSYTFKFPQENHKTVPVVPVCDISFRSQYTQKAPLRIAPDSVIVYGEPAFLETIERVYTRKISFSNVSSDKFGTVRLESPRGVRLSDTEVGYSLEVSRFVEIKRTVDISFRNVPSGKELYIYPSTAEVVFRCAFPISADRSPDVHFYVDYNDFLTSSTGRCVARADELPAGVFGWKMQPEIFECVEEGR